MPFKVILLTTLGFFFLAAGAIGLLLPVWPTTPFVLIAAACFSCTPRLRAQIMRIGFFREHIENYERRTGLGRKTVAISLGYLWAMLLLSVYCLDTLWVRLLLLFIGAAVTVHILCIARPKEQRKKDTDETGFRQD